MTKPLLTVHSSWPYSDASNGASRNRIKIMHIEQKRHGIFRFGWIIIVLASWMNDKTFSEYFLSFFVSNLPLHHYASNENTFASKGLKLIYWGPLKPLENALLRSPITPWAYFASNLYHNEYWLRFIGKKRIEKAMKTGWGALFQSY